MLERTLYRRLYGASPLDQVLFTIGLVLMAMPIADFFLGDEPQQVNLPAWLSGSVTFHGVGISLYRLFIVVVCGLIAAALQLFLVKTRFGAQLRAAVDDARVADGLGINVDRIFAVTFAVGSGLAGLGGALAADVVGGIDPVLPGQVSGDLPDRRHHRRLERDSRARCSARCCSACSTSPANITSPRSAPSSSTRVMVVTLILRPQGLFARGDGR